MWIVAQADADAPSLLPNIITLGGAILAAGFSGWYAARSRRAQAKAEKALAREQRLFAKKEDVYTPLVKSLQSIMDGIKDPKKAQSEKQLASSISEFTTWAQFYGSDDVVVGFKRFLSASAAQSPVEITMYYYGQLLLAIRRDLGDPDTGLDASDLVALRMNDWYESGMRDTLRLEEHEIHAKYDWVAPWA